MKQVGMQHTAFYIKIQLIDPSIAGGNALLDESAICFTTTATKAGVVTDPS
jgi:hypothetical protein